MYRSRLVSLLKVIMKSGDQYSIQEMPGAIPVGGKCTSLPVGRVHSGQGFRRQLDGAGSGPHPAVS